MQGLDINTVIVRMRNPNPEGKMISGEQIQQAVERLVAASNQSKVILFGAYLYGDATEGVRRLFCSADYHL